MYFCPSNVSSESLPLDNSCDKNILSSGIGGY